MEDEATDAEKEMGAAWTRENVLDPLHEEYERYAQAQRQKEDPGSNPGWDENDDDESALFFSPLLLFFGKFAL